MLKLENSMLTNNMKVEKLEKSSTIKVNIFEEITSKDDEKLQIKSQLLSNVNHQ